MIGSELPTFPESILAKVERVPGVGEAEGELASLGNLVVDGEVVETFGAPGLVMADTDDRFDPTEIVEGQTRGRPARRRCSRAMPTTTASRSGIGSGSPRDMARSRSRSPA